MPYSVMVHVGTQRGPAVGADSAHMHRKLTLKVIHGCPWGKSAGTWESTLCV